MPVALPSFGSGGSSGGAGAGKGSALSRARAKYQRGSGKAGSKSKTQRPECSQAMSDWKLHGMSSSVASTLGRCRAAAHAKRQSELHAAAGNDLKAASLAHRSTKDVVGKGARLAKARELHAARAANAAKAAGVAHTASHAADGTAKHGVAAHAASHAPAGQPKASAAPVAPAMTADQHRAEAAKHEAIAEKHGKVADAFKRFVSKGKAPTMHQRAAADSAESKRIVARHEAAHHHGEANRLMAGGSAGGHASSPVVAASATPVVASAGPVVTTPAVHTPNPVLLAQAAAKRATKGDKEARLNFIKTRINSKTQSLEDKASRSRVPGKIADIKARAAALASRGKKVDTEWRKAANARIDRDQSKHNETMAKRTAHEDAARKPGTTFVTSGGVRYTSTGESWGGYSGGRSHSDMPILRHEETGQKTKVTWLELHSEFKVAAPAHAATSAPRAAHDPYTPAVVARARALGHTPEQSDYAERMYRMSTHQQIAEAESLGVHNASRTPIYQLISKSVEHKYRSQAIHDTGPGPAKTIVVPPDYSPKYAHQSRPVPPTVQMRPEPVSRGEAIPARVNKGTPESRTALARIKIAEYRRASNTNTANDSTRAKAANEAIQSLGEHGRDSVRAAREAARSKGLKIIAARQAKEAAKIKNMFSTPTFSVRSFGRTPEESHYAEVAHAMPRKLKLTEAKQLGIKDAAKAFENDLTRRMVLAKFSRVSR